MTVWSPECSAADFLYFSRHFLLHECMIRFYSFSSAAARDFIEAAGWRCTMLESSHERLRGAVALAPGREGDLLRAASFLDRLSSRHTVYLVLIPPRRAGDGLVSRQLASALSGKECEFIHHFISDDVVKKTLCELGISKSGYYKMLKRILGKLDLPSAEHLRFWALINLSL